MSNVRYLGRTETYRTGRPLFSGRFAYTGRGWCWGILAVFLLLSTPLLIMASLSQTQEMNSGGAAITVSHWTPTTYFFAIAGAVAFLWVAAKAILAYLLGRALFNRTTFVPQPYEVSDQWGIASLDPPAPTWDPPTVPEQPTTPPAEPSPFTNREHATIFVPTFFGNRPIRELSETAGGIEIRDRRSVGPEDLA